MHKKIYIALGFLSLGLGVLGSVLPVLPTTPFVLLSAYLFSKSSEKWYKWLISIPKFGKNIEDWNDHGVISKKAKITCFISITLVIIWINAGLAIHLYPKVLLTIILISVLTYVCTRPSSKQS